MFGIILSAFILVFGVFLKVTQHPGFASSKKLAWMLIAIGALSLVFKILNYK
ncbi:hypothetical protein [Chryseobacterium paridis]|uniref:hypothetical protein n=1 Tax=Chryseobacterium paridis TaxID=2800328 RepID=UPI001F3F26C1|nr:hypothetical protein [Chryseobacterium paridis]